MMHGWKNIALLLLALGVPLLSLGCRGKGRWVEQEVEDGFRGKARQDPFLACKRTLEEWGYDVNTSRQLRDLPPAYGTLILSPDTVSSALSTKRLERWVQSSGGHLIYCLGGANRTSFFEVMDDSDEDDPVLERFGFERSFEWESDDDGGESESEDAELFTVAVGDERKLKVEISGGYSVRKTSGGRREVFTNYGRAPYKFYSEAYGEGRMTVLAHAGALNNKNISSHDHARFIITLVGQGYAEEVWFAVRGKKGSQLLALMWREGWMVVIGLTVLVGFWLWKNMPRFGPVTAGEGVGLGAASRERFGDHLSTGGRFLWRRKCGSTLLEPMRRSIAKAYQRECPGADPAAYMEWVSERSGVPMERVQRALDVQMITDGAIMLGVVQDLQTIQNTL